MVHKRSYSAILMIIGTSIFWISITYLLQERYICVVKNISQSLPFSYFVGVKISEPRVGMYVTFYHPEIKGLLVKRITGLFKDKISIEKTSIFINGEFKGTAKSISSSGFPLSVIESQTIPQGYAFVQGLHPDSFDSRYKEFGLIPLSQIKEQVWPIF